MKQTEVIRAARLCEACLCIVLAMTSCSKGNEDAKNGGGENPTGVVTVAEVPRELTKVERLEGECRRLVAEAGRIKGWTWSVSCDLCNEICKLSKEEALPLLDRLLEMAIECPVTNANSSAILGKHKDLFEIVLCSFIASQGLRANSFEGWDKVFRFFKKYTDEITAEEKRIKELDQPQTNLSYKYKHFRYLQDLQLHVENLVHNARTVFSNTLSQGLTEEQKADILRRFKEVEKYTVPPPNSPYSKSNSRAGHQTGQG